MKLSIAVAAKGNCDPRAFLDAIDSERITGSPGVEVHIAHDEDWPATHSELPGNITLHRCPRGTSILRLWGVAIARSSGEYVAVLDIRCPPVGGWLECVGRAMQDGVPLFFGPVDPGWKRDNPAIVGYLAEYAQFSSPLAAGLNEVPGNNVVCRRSLLDANEKLLNSGFYKTFMVWRLEQEMRLKPARFDAMAVCYRKPFSYGHYMHRRCAHGRCFGATRHENAGQPPRLVCVVSCFVLPLVRMWRIHRAVRGRGDLSYAFYRFFYLLLQSEVAWSYGELVGYIRGDRSVCASLD